MKKDEPVPMNPDETFAERWVGAAPERAPSAEARERARAAFLTGDPAGIVPSSARGPVRRRRTAWTWIAAAAAAAALTLWGTTPSEQWTITTVQGTAHLDGQVVHVDGRAGSGNARTTSDSWFETSLGERLLVRVAPGSRVDLPAGPGRWFAGQRTLRVEEGEVFASTGNESLGFPLQIETPEATTTIVGTTFAVRRNELGTCVCLLDGQVDLKGAHGEEVSVPTGRRIQIFSDGAEPMVEDLTAAESAMLLGLRERRVASR
ncbi:MAG: hypothetical protein DHS20C21_12780 [Gemmatimonadota bacterium]|nr:MAG: hypothetical protein DHS20C21_12780 [Gemmatimonadota bacterium]